MLIAWAVAFAIALGLSAAFGGTFTNDSSAPGSDSAQAQSLLGERFPAQSGDTERVVVRAGNVSSAGVRSAVKALLGELERMPHVTSVEDPYATKGAITPDGRTLVARVYLDVINPNDMPKEDTKKLLAAVQAAERDGLNIALLIGGVVVVSMLLLLVAFRSVVIAITAAVMNLLSVAAAYGVVAFFLKGGWAGKLIGIDTATPLAAFVPVIMFALLFGLSMDYEVFLISRVREAWVRTRDNSQSITTGLASTGRVITAAAAIMIVVFAAIIPSDQVFIKISGVGMVAAILVDATIIRMLLVPAVMHLLGRGNWWLPRSMARHLPQLHIEGPPMTSARRLDDAELIPTR